MNLRMHRPSVAAVLTFIALIASRPSIAADELPVDPAQESALLKTVGAGFQLRRTPHFLVVHNSDPVIVNGFVSRVEQTYSVIFRFCQLNKIEARRPRRRLEVVFYDKRAQFDEYARSIRFPAEGAYGVYYEPNNRSTFFNVSSDPDFRQIHADLAAARASLEKLSDSLRTLRDERARIIIHYGDGRVATLTRPEAQQELDKSRRQLTALDAQRVAYSERINRTVVQHEVTHQVLFNAGVHVRGGENPKWLVEGLACLFETPPDSSSTGSGIFAINQLRLQDFRTAVAGSREGSPPRLTGKDFVAAIAQERFPSAEKMVSDSKVFEGRGDLGAANYAMAWALVHYLQRERPAALAAYIKEISSRRPGENREPNEELALFSKHFGPVNSSFVTRCGDYILRLPVRSLMPRP